VRACVRTLAPPNPAPFHTAKARRGLRRQILENHIITVENQVWALYNGTGHLKS